MAIADIEIEKKIDGKDVKIIDSSVETAKVDDPKVHSSVTVGPVLVDRNRDNGDGTYQSTVNVTFDLLDADGSPMATVVRTLFLDDKRAELTDKTPSDDDIKKAIDELLTDVTAEYVK